VIAKEEGVGKREINKKSESMNDIVVLAKDA
jgi:hypothetical protein